MPFHSLFLSSNEKIVPGKEPSLKSDHGRCYENERFSFQFAFKNEEVELFFHFPKVTLESEIQDWLIVRNVESVPVSLPVRKARDDDYITYDPCFLPDLLKDDDVLNVGYGIWKSVLITYKGGAKPGRYPITVKLEDGAGNVWISATYVLEVLEGELPPLRIHYSNWLHYDSLANYYGVEPFSKPFYEILWKFVDDAAIHGMDTLLVPPFTPALDTNVGAERKTTQLVKVQKKGDVYAFNFDFLLEFLKEADRHGMKRYEFSHLFTQWGAEHAQKVMDEEGVRLFGWETDSKDSKYLSFLKQYFYELLPLLKRNGFGPDRVFFHLSDEPNMNHLERYLYLKKELAPALGEYKICDALSNIEFYEKGAVELPACALEFVPDFLEKEKRDIMVYYCSGQADRHLSNRLLAMPLRRTRIIGIQLYRTGVQGLLHWGYNFYGSAFSKRPINPYEVNDADGSFPSGDSFIVYPAADGHPYDSLRHEMMSDAFNDYRLLCKLEEKCGKPFVLDLLEKEGVKDNFTDYPLRDAWLLEFREKIIDLLK